MKKIVKILVLAVLLIIAGLATARYALIADARHKADIIIIEALKHRPHVTPDEKVTSITAYVFEHFEHRDPATMFVAKLRPFLGNERLPDFIRIPNGVVATEKRMGFCDGAARMLGFVLKQEGFNSVQWNMVQPDSAHSALAVYMPDGRKVLADPFYGYVAKQNGKLISPEQALALAKQKTPMDKIFTALSDKSEPGFYRSFEKVSMSAQGDPLEIKARIPRLQGKALEFGTINGSNIDVRSEGTKHAMTPFLDYMGHKYNRNYVRVLEAGQPVKVEMTLTAPADDGIMIADPAPAVDGKILTWNLKAGDKITLRDRLAKLSLLRMNSYIPIDQIVFTPIN